MKALRSAKWVATVGLSLGLVGAFAPGPRAELLEDIVANVNGGIITRSELQEEQERMLAEAYKRFTGEELDKRVAVMKERMLADMIDRRLLLDRALALFTDVDNVKQMYYEGFKQSQNIEDDAEFARMLAQEGMTVEDFKQRLLEVYAPEEVLRVEVGNRVAVSDAEVERFYQANIDQFDVEDEVTVREIVVLADGDDDRDDARARAEALLTRVQGGEAFADVAGEASDAGTKTNGGLLGTVGRGDLSARLEEVAFELEEGEVSAPIETPYGYHILMVESRKVDERRGLEEVRENVRRLLEERKYQEELDRFLAKLRDEAEWCVRPKYRDRIPDGFEAEICKEM